MRGERRTAGGGRWEKVKVKGGGWGTASVRGLVVVIATDWVCLEVVSAERVWDWDWDGNASAVNLENVAMHCRSLAVEPV